jgi:alpha 1,3-glucosidase
MKIYLLFVVVRLVLGVDRNNFKKCDESSFCKRHRKLESRDSPYVVKPETVSIGTSSVTLEIENTEKKVVFAAELNSLTDGRARLRILEKNPIRHRYEVQGALIGEPELERLDLESKDDSSLTVSSSNRKVVVSYSPFRVDFMIDETAVVTLNAQGLLEFEHYREKRDANPPVETNKDDEVVESDSNDGQQGDNDVNSNGKECTVMAFNK